MNTETRPIVPQRILPPIVPGDGGNVRCATDKVHPIPPVSLFHSEDHYMNWDDAIQRVLDTEHPYARKATALMSCFDAVGVAPPDTVQTDLVRKVVTIIGTPNDVSWRMHVCDDGHIWISSRRSPTLSPILTPEDA